MFPWQIRKDYLEQFHGVADYIKQKCHEYRVEYNPITTDTPFEQNLMNYLIKRSRLH